jgi:hypothetical protein
MNALGAQGRIRFRCPHAQAEDHGHRKDETGAGCSRHGAVATAATGRHLSFRPGIAAHLLQRATPPPRRDPQEARLPQGAATSSVRRRHQRQPIRRSRLPPMTAKATARSPCGRNRDQEAASRTRSWFGACGSEMPLVLGVQFSRPVLAMGNPRAADYAGAWSRDRS